MSSAERYAYEIDPDSDTAGAYVLKLVGRGQRVLEIGAGPGAIARPLAEQRQCSVTAVELDADAVAILESFCDAAVQADLNTPDWTVRLPTEPYDCAIAADVLEHVIEPQRVLGELAAMSKHRRVVVSLPHVGHNGLVACLMSSNFRYGPWGLLDDTHIRFFGLANIENLFAEAGLAIRQVEFVRIAPTATEFADIWRDLPIWKRLPLLTTRSGDVYQVVVEASDRTVDGPVVNLEAECRRTFYPTKAKNWKGAFRALPKLLRR